MFHRGDEPHGLSRFFKTPLEKMIPEVGGILLGRGGVKRECEGVQNAVPCSKKLKF